MWGGVLMSEVPQYPGRAVIAGREKGAAPPCGNTLRLCWYPRVQDFTESVCPIIFLFARNPPADKDLYA